MAPVGEGDRENSYLDQNNEEEEENLWSTILGEVQSSSSTKLPSGKTLLVLGENESGKTTLMAKLQGNEEPKKGSGLEYMYLDVKDDYRDDHTRLGVWILDGDLHHRGLLKFAVTQENLSDTCVLLVASMAQPWSLMESLEKWAEVLSTHIDRLKVAPEKRRNMEERLTRHFQEYVEPGDETSQSWRSTGPASRTSGVDEKVLLPLGEDTLTHNLGVPIIVVITKCDAISMLEKENDFREEHFDFIQQHIRKFCLKYGAALVYTSVKEEKNCDLLHRYFLHQIYTFPFSSPAFVVERDTVFVPTGWDNTKKISILFENMMSMKPEDAYEQVITRPSTHKLVHRDTELIAEDEQVFLMKQQTMLSKQPTAGQRESPLRTATGVQKPPMTRVSTSPAAQAGLAGSPKKLEAGKPGTGTNEGVLANFFNSLLSKKTGTSPAGSKSTERAAVSREVDRMTRVKEPSGSHSNSSAS
ncbi:hypothetical protein NP493_84g05025 [Ridgeia piscesae]|uniref:Dynein light intermediate chain n=1 Tax=Ridgeia piscesae TaxID=27915 RepID=A0AAD9P9A1_RIDPI|nr:hypothetical protein NP493_84g05025 [Ridgeia piscesae]